MIRKEFLRVCDLPLSQIRVGLVIKSLVFNSTKRGIVVQIEPDNDDAAWVQWEDKDYAHSCFYGNSSQCIVLRLAPWRKN